MRPEIIDFEEEKKSRLAREILLKISQREFVDNFAQDLQKFKIHDDYWGLSKEAFKFYILNRGEIDRIVKSEELHKYYTSYKYHLWQACSAEDEEDMAVAVDFRMRALDIARAIAVLFPKEKNNHDFSEALKFCKKIIEHAKQWYNDDFYLNMGPRERFLSSLLSSVILEPLQIEELADEVLAVLDSFSATNEETVKIVGSAGNITLALQCAALKKILIPESVITLPVSSDDLIKMSEMADRYIGHNLLDGCMYLKIVMAQRITINVDGIECESK